MTIEPANCTAAWNNLTISGKYITLNGNGANIERSGTSGQAVAITVNSGGLTRLTNFDFSETDDSGFSPEAIVGVSSCTYSGASPNASFRIDNSTFTGDGVTHIYIGCHGRGLIDNNTFDVASGNEVIQNFGGGDGASTGWTDDVAPGSADAMYVEDNTFNGTGGADKTAQFYGSRGVYRYNTWDCVQMDVHGNRPRSGRWWEAYNNTHLRVSCSASYNNRWYQIRGGSGLIFNNTMTADSDDNILFWQDGTSPGPGHPSGGPRNVSGGEDHVGSGKNQVQTAAYVFGNVSLDSIGVDQADTGSCGSCIAANRDYFAEGGSFDGTSGVGVGVRSSRPATCSLGSGGDPGVGYWSTDQGGDWDTTHGGSNDGCLDVCTATNTWTNCSYTPYTYPHPLRDEGGGGEPASSRGGNAMIRWLFAAAGIALLGGIYAARIGNRWGRGRAGDQVSAAATFGVGRRRAVGEAAE